MSITSKAFTIEDEQFLIKNYNVIGPKGCSKFLNRTYMSIRTKANRLGLLSNKFHRPQNNNNKICGKCQVEKPKNEFGIDRARKDGLHPICKTCLLEQRKLNKNKKAQYDRQYRKNNIQKIQTYVLNNKLKIRKRKTEYSKKWRKIPHNRILQSLRTRLRIALKNKHKIFHTVELLGCSVAEFKTYIESKFSKNMSWYNYGKWHLDHIKPCSSFDLNDPIQQKACFHYSNIQPLWAKDNLIKSNKII